MQRKDFRNSDRFLLLRIEAVWLWASGRALHRPDLLDLPPHAEVRRAWEMDLTVTERGQGRMGVAVSTRGQ